MFKFRFRADRVRSLKREVTLFRVMKERLGEHPHIAGVKDVYLEEPPFYLTMEYVAGRDLKTWSEANGGAGTIPLETRLEIVAQVAEALQAAHDAGVIHRDVKPSNILVAADVSRRLTSPSEAASEESAAFSRTQLRVQVKLTDFGIGQVVSEEALAGRTRLGFTETLLPTGRAAQAGTYLYMAPELLMGKSVSKQSDVYSLGVVFFQLIVGDLTRPVTTDWYRDWYRTIVDPVLSGDLRSCLAGNPQERGPGAGQLAQNLRSWRNRQRRERISYGFQRFMGGILAWFGILAGVSSIYGFPPVPRYFPAAFSISVSVIGLLVSTAGRRYKNVSMNVSGSLLSRMGAPLLFMVLPDLLFRRRHALGGSGLFLHGALWLFIGITLLRFGRFGRRPYWIGKVQKRWTGNGL